MCQQFQTKRKPAIISPYFYNLKINFNGPLNFESMALSTTGPYCRQMFL